MSKIKNSVYGLALGDSIGYRTEFISFKEILLDYAREDLKKATDPLIVSDDTQMSLYLLKGFREAYAPDSSLQEQTTKLISAIAKNFVLWLNDGENGRAPGVACIRSLEVLEKELDSFAYHTKSLGGLRVHVDDFLVGGATQKNSKGSGTVMRSPWVGLLYGMGVIPADYLEEFCYLQASITHQHPTALAAAYLTAVLTGKLYTGELSPGQLGDFAKDFCAKQESNLGWRDLSDTLDNLDKFPIHYTSTKASEFDVSIIIGSKGTAEDVLVSAIALIDNFGNDPVGVIQRAMFSGGDSDTIGAVAGGMIGAYYAEDIWTDIEHLTEELYIPQLNSTIQYMESLKP